MNPDGHSIAIFEKHYHHLRNLENRVFSDEIVLQLPYVNKGGHKNEWRLRAKSAQRFIKYLSKNKGLTNILEVGSGNGWFTHQMNLHSGAQVYGIEVNKLELAQAKRLFQNERTHFIEFDLNESIWPGPMPNWIVFNASIQYFADLSKILESCLNILSTGGEIHIIDSPFYAKENLKSAKIRSEIYFKNMNVPEMIQFYYHHSKDELASFKPQYLYSPAKFPMNRLFKDSPFPWVRITKNE
jgi:ubiquinone/menaquinone biosynthesis C-methylase UbiE